MYTKYICFPLSPESHPAESTKARFELSKVVKLIALPLDHIVPPETSGKSANVKL